MFEKKKFKIKHKNVLALQPRGLFALGWRVIDDFFVCSEKAGVERFSFFVREMASLNM